MKISAILMLAQNPITNPQINPDIADEKNWDFFIWLLPNLFNIILVAGAVVFFFMLITGGVQWISSSGSRDKIESAKNKITWAVLGFVMLILVFLGVRTINTLFGIDIGRLPGATSNEVLNVPSGSSFQNIQQQNLQLVLSQIIEIVLVIAVIVFVMMLLVGGIRWMSSAGNAAELEVAKKTLRNAIVGLVITFSIFVVGYFVGAIFDTDIGGSPSSMFTSTPTPTGGAGGGVGGSVGSGCVIDSDCSSGFCSNNTDADSDGYYLAYSGVGSGTCQVGPEDCNDANFDVHPNQTQYFEAPISGTNYNYDCTDSDGDGDVNDKWYYLNCLSSSAVACTTAFPGILGLISSNGWETSIPNCGEDITSAVTPTNEFIACLGSSSLTCSPPIYSRNNNNASCSLGCPQVCDDPATPLTENCNSWQTGSWQPFLGGYTLMPCK